MITEQQKQIIDAHINFLSTRGETHWHSAFQNLASIKNKPEETYLRLVKELQDQMVDGPQGMRDILGSSYRFFKEFKIDNGGVTEKVAIGT